MSSDLVLYERGGRGGVRGRQRAKPSSDGQNSSRTASEEDMRLLSKAKRAKISQIIQQTNHGTLITKKC